MPVHSSQQAGARRNLVTAEMISEAGCEEELVDDLAAVILARPGIGNADDVEIAAEIALGAVLPAHQRPYGAEAGAQRQHRLRPAGGRDHVPGQVSHEAVRNYEIEVGLR